jgi:hypothetical protein
MVIAADVLNPELVEKQPQILRLPRYAVPACSVAQDDNAIVREIQDSERDRFLHLYAKEIRFR